MKIKQTFGTKTLLLAALLSVSAGAQANSLFDVTLDTSGLSGSFGLLFQFNDGSQSGDGNNTATISNFSYGIGGSAIDCNAFPLLCAGSGGATGAANAGSTLSMTDSSAFNSYLQQFTAGTLLSFRVELSTNVDAGGTPDVFTLNILDALSGNALPTNDPGQADTLLAVNIDSSTPTIGSFDSAAGAFSAPLVSPVIAPPPGNVPEPETLLLIGIGLLGFSLNYRIKPRIQHKSCCYQA